MTAEKKLSILDILSLIGDNYEEHEPKLNIRYTEAYAKWLSRLRDRKIVVKIAAYFGKAQAIGDLHGDFKVVGDHVIEVRFDVGPGYRVYVTRKGATLVLLLIGGDKSTQDKDIRKAKALAKEWRREHENI